MLSPSFYPPTAHKTREHYDLVVGQFEDSSEWDKLPFMLFMVIERFKHGNTRLIGERFKQSGRMLPEGVTYHVSWVDSMGTRCFQVMETAHRQSLDAWLHCWDDLIEFEVVPVLTSTDFWTKTQPE
jgi:hypothetical protein